MSYIIPLIITVVVVVIVVAVVVAVRTTFSKLPSIGGKAKQIGEDCTFHTDCAGNSVVMQPGTCCNATTKKCEQKVQDFRGNWYCSDIAVIGKKEGEPCTKAEDCQGVGIGLEPGTYCCEGKCKTKVMDRSGGYWCPNEAITGELGGRCIVHTDCKGNTPVFQAGTCCNGKTKKCEQKVKDYAGNYYCSDEAIIGKALGSTCTRAEDCQGFTLGVNPGVYCCSGVCKQKVQDRAGAYYCPEEAITGKSGSRCIVDTDCEGWGAGSTAMACCSGICKQKVPTGDIVDTGRCP